MSARRLSLLCALLFSAGAARAEPAQSTVALTLTAADYGGGRISAPMRFGAVQGRMRLDTGASTSRIALAPWNKDWPVLGAARSTGAFGQTSNCEDVEAKAARMVASQGDDVARASYVVSRCPTNDGDDLLGLDFFRGARITLDIPGRELIFFNTKPPAGPAKMFRVMGPDRKLIGLETLLGKQRVVALFDTGAEISAVDTAFVLRHKALFTPVKNRQAASEAGGSRLSGQIYALKALTAGGLDYRGLYVLAYDFGVLRRALGDDAPLILGHNFIANYVWEIDLTHPDSPTWRATPSQTARKPR